MITLAWVLLMISSVSTNAPQAQSAPASAPATSPPTSQPGASAVGFIFKTLTIEKATYAYSIYVPPEYTPDRAWPVILFLHGSGERGGDGLLQTEVGIGSAIRRNRSLCPAFVVMPQCRSGDLWVRQMAEVALRSLDETAREYRVDPDRTYLTGLSMGGFGAWFLAERLPGRFAAVVPICGFYGQPSAVTDPEVLGQMAEKLRGTPIWCFHGALDTAVPVARSREIVGAIRAAGGDVKYIEFADGPHDVWSRVYSDPSVWSWMLAQRRSPATAPTSRPAP